MDLGPIIERPLTTKGSLVEIIRELDMNASATSWVAGGAALSLARGFGELRAASDIDLFFATKEDFLAFDKRMTEASPQVVTAKKQMQSAYRSYTYNRRKLFASTRVTIQLIEIAFYEDVAAIFDSFDFTICMFSTDGYVLRGPQQAWDDLETKTLRLHTGKTTGKTLRRLPKYCAMGFAPGPGMLSSLLNEQPHGYTFDSNKMCLNNDSETEY